MVEPLHDSFGNIDLHPDEFPRKIRASGNTRTCNGHSVKGRWLCTKGATQLIVHADVITMQHGVEFDHVAYCDEHMPQPDEIEGRIILPHYWQNYALYRRDDQGQWVRQDG